MNTEQPVQRHAKRRLDERRPCYQQIHLGGGSESFFSALDQGEKITFKFDSGSSGGNTAPKLNLAFNNTNGYLAVLGTDSAIKGYTHSAAIAAGSSGAYVYTAHGTSSYYSLSAINDGATLEHVKQVNMEQFSVYSGLTAVAVPC